MLVAHSLNSTADLRANTQTTESDLLLELYNFLVEILGGVEGPLFCLLLSLFILSFRLMLGDELLDRVVSIRRVCCHWTF